MYQCVVSQFLPISITSDMFSCAFTNLERISIYLVLLVNQISSTVLNHSCLRLIYSAISNYKCFFDWGSELWAKGRLWFLLRSITTPALISTRCCNNFSGRLFFSFLPSLIRAYHPTSFTSDPNYCDVLAQTWLINDWLDDSTAKFCSWSAVFVLTFTRLHSIAVWFRECARKVE